MTLFNFLCVLAIPLMCVGAEKKLKTSGQVSASLFYREGIRPLGIKKQNKTKQRINKRITADI